MAASWPSTAASFGGPRPTFISNHPVQAAWMEIVPRLHELCKLVENMAAAPCADQYFDIFNRHTALLAKIEELEPSPDPMSVPHSFSIPNPPARTVLPDLVSSIYESAAALDESFSFGTPLQQIAPLHLHTPTQPSHQHQAPPAPAAPQMQHASVSAAHQVQQQLFVQSVSHHGNPAPSPHHGQYSSKSAPRTTTPAANPGFYMYQPPQAHSPAPVFQHSAAPQMQPSPISQVPTTGIRQLPAYEEAAFHKSEARRDSNAGMMAPPAGPGAGAAGAVRTKRNKQPASASSKRHQQAQLRKESPSSESIGTPDEESDSEDRDKKKRKNRPKEKRASTHPNQSCRQCGATETPEWRRGPDGSHTLCNACGLRFSKQLRKRGEEEVAAALEAAAQAPQGNTDGLVAHPLHSQSNSSVYSFSNEHMPEPPPDEVPLATELPPAATNA